MIRSSLGLGGLLLVVATSAVVFACSSSTDSASSSSGGTGTQSTAAAVAGEADKHCGATVVKVDPAACTAAHDEDAGQHDHDAGDEDAASQDDPGDDDFGDTMNGSAGNDDDCKYKLSWTSSPVSENAGVTFVLTVANLTDNTPVTGAKPYIEAFLDEHTPATNSNPQTSEASGGIYTIGPIVFPKAGKWTVRFHISGDCADAVDSPHGHGAFFVAVP